jgi:hypothetical protein
LVLPVNENPRQLLDKESMTTMMTSKIVGRAAAMWAPLILLGCGRVPGQFLVVQNQAPQTTCVISADPGALYRGQGTLDVGIVNDQAVTAYQIFPLLENDLPAPAAGQQSDSNRIALSGFDVDLAVRGPAPSNVASLLQLLEQDAGGRTLLHFRIPWSGSVESGGGHTAATVDAVPAELARRIRGTGDLQTTAFFQLEAQIRATGDRLTGSIESDPFTYPIVVCDGCLVANVAACPFRNAAANPGNACNPAQDTPVDCCSQNGQLVCPPVVGSP